MQIKKLVLMAAVAGLSLTLLFGQNPDTDSQNNALDILREKRMQLDNPQTVTQSKIFIIQQKEFEAKAEAARARAEEAGNRAKAASAKAAEPPTATEKLNRPAYEQKRLELIAEKTEAEAEVAQAEVDAILAQVDALKSKVAAAKAKADEVRTSPYRRAQSKYYDAQWQEQLEKKTLEEQTKASKESATKTRVAAEALRRAKLARDNARKSALALAAKTSGVTTVAPKATDEEMARRAHELELAQAKAETEAAIAREHASKVKVTETAAKVQVANDHKQADLDAEALRQAKAEIARKNKEDETLRNAQARKAEADAELVRQAKAEIARKNKEEENFRNAQVKDQGRKAEADANALRKAKQELARKTKEEEKQRLALAKEEARKAEQQAEALRQQKIEVARQAKELEAETRKASVKKQEKPAVVALRSAPVQPTEAESETQAKALEALRAKQADLDALDARNGKTTSKSSSPTATAKSDDSAQEKALAALREKQAALDVQETQARMAAMSAKERVKAEAKAQKEREVVEQARALAEPVKVAPVAPVVSTPAPRSEVASLSSDTSVQEKAVEALRAKQAALDVEEAKARTAALAPRVTAPVVAAPTPAPVRTEAPPQKKVVVKDTSAPKSKADELDLAALSAKSREPVVERTTAPAPRIEVSSAEIDAETRKRQELVQRQADLRAKQIKVKTDLQNAVRSGSEKKTTSDDAIELVVDNAATRAIGTWMTGKTRGFYGSDYVWKGKGTGANYVKFVPVIPMAGDYEVYEWHVGGTNRASDAPYIISYNGGTQTILVNQQNNGAKWNLLGKFNFAQGSSGEVRITDGISTAGHMVMVDAIRFVAANGSSGAPVVAESDSKEVEELRKQQSALDAELAEVKQAIAASDKSLATMKQAEESAQIHAAEQQAIRNATGTPAVKSQTTKAVEKVEPKKNVKTSVANTLTPEVVATLSPKEKKLAEILVRYKADEITPHEYHQMRAKIIAEP